MLLATSATADAAPTMPSYDPNVSGLCTAAARTIWNGRALAITPEGAVVVLGTGGVCGYYWAKSGGNTLSNGICYASRQSWGGWARWTVARVTGGRYQVC